MKYEEEGKLRGIKRLNLGISFSPLSVVLNLMIEVIIRMHVLIKRRHQKRISRIGPPLRRPLKEEWSPFEERRKPPSIAKMLVTSARHLKDEVQESMLDKGCTKS